MRRLALLLLYGVLAVPSASALAQKRTDGTSGHAFVVIGPDSLTMRAWTAQWAREEIARVAPQLSRGLLAHDSLILRWLDTEDWSPTSPPPGPSAELGEVPYPHDLRTPLILADMRAVTRIARVRSFAQVIIEVQDGGYRLTAQVLHARDLDTPTHLTVEHSSLRAAARIVAQQLAIEWGAQNP